MRYAVVAVLLAGCADSPLVDRDLHQVVECQTGWPALNCEIACADRSPEATGGSCRGRWSPAAGQFDCTGTFEFDGVEGCCIVDDTSGTAQVYFAVCGE